MIRIEAMCLSAESIDMRAGTERLTTAVALGDVLHGNLLPAVRRRAFRARTRSGPAVQKGLNGIKEGLHMGGCICDR